MHLLSLLLGLVFAWGLLLFIGPKKCTTSYYVQAPVVGAPIMDDVDKMMEAVGLSRQARASAPTPEPSVADIALEKEVPEQSVADMAQQEEDHVADATNSF